MVEKARMSVLITSIQVLLDAPDETARQGENYMDTVDTDGQVGK